VRGQPRRTNHRKAVSELPRDPRSTQPRNPEPLPDNECAQLSAMIVKANTNADNATTRAMMFHLAGTFR
jgi:hypothetical protein